MHTLRLIVLFMAACLLLNATTIEGSDIEKKIFDKISARSKILLSKEKSKRESKLFCSVSFYVRKDGALKSLEIFKSSDILWYDKICLRAVRESAPFPALPASYFTDSDAKFFKIGFQTTE